MTSPEQIEVMELEGYSRPTHNNGLVWRNFLSPKCRNESHDPDHAYLGNSYSSEG